MGDKNHNKEHATDSKKESKQRKDKFYGWKN